MNFGSIKARVVRLTRLDACGVVVTGNGSLVTDGFISVEIAPSYDDGETFQQKNAWGDFCVNEQDDPRLTEVGLSVNFCKVVPEAYDIVANARTIVSGAAAVGAAFGEDAIADRFALEAWTKVPGQACGATGDPLWVYWVFPNVGGGRVGGITLENGLATFPTEARTKGAPASWGDGPYADSPLPTGETLLENEHWAVTVTDTQPPAVTNGFANVA